VLGGIEIGHPPSVTPAPAPFLNETDAYRELPFEGLQCVWVRRADGPVRVLPDACADLVWQSGRGVLVAGPDTGPVVTTPRSGTVVVGARFAPGSGGPALGHPLHDLRDTRVDAADLLPELDRALPGDLAPEEALRRIGALAARLVAAAPPDAAVREAARRLADPATQVSTLAADLGLSERQLRRRCDTAAGYGPKTLQRVLRFRRLLDAGDDDLAGAAFAAGYADQAHMTREVGRLAGLTPAKLLGSR
jgi:AraC-like DNA-binding protein